mmetsp:Transcript_6247/g.13647  ORF Transcript_6247/g.13647 Transcript_6247/m.13647 type:complete len:230 (+) Transcript_6247:2-691(+)
MMMIIPITPLITSMATLLVLVSKYTTAFSSSTTRFSRVQSNNEMKATVYIALTIDGYIADEDGSVDFLTKFQTSAEDDMGFSSFLDSIDLMIMGRKTWDQVVSFGEEVWPYGEKPVWIWSRSPDSVMIPECRKRQARAMSSLPEELIERAAGEGYSHVYVDGGSTIQEFMKSNYIQELILARVPLILGDGIPLFSKVNRAELCHLSTKCYKNGIVQSHYSINQISIVQT